MAIVDIPDDGTVGREIGEFRDAKRYLAVCRSVGKRCQDKEKSNSFHGLMDWFDFAKIHIFFFISQKYNIKVCGKNLFLP